MKISKYTFLVKKDSDVLLVNTYSGAVSKIDTNIENYIESNLGDMYRIDDEDYNILVRNRYIVPKELDEYQKILDKEQEDIYGSTKKASYVIAPTMTCNYHCNYCFENDAECKHTMTADVLSEVSNFIIRDINNKKLTGINISWFGGEPLLCIEQIKKISQILIEYCEKNNISYKARMITNGYLVDDDIIEIMVKCNISHVQITLDGFEEVYEYEKQAPKGAYKKVIENILKLSKSVKVVV